ncbi:hypothetical protein LY78DRAFT_196621 [Colletotrichum sublineola]|nr:hypothetical protein LY78DRAFT_196621 [Colletotrichum sublineola]
MVFVFPLCPSVPLGLQVPRPWFQIPNPSFFNMCVSTDVTAPSGLSTMGEAHRPTTCRSHPVPVSTPPLITSLQGRPPYLPSMVAILFRPLPWSYFSCGSSYAGIPFTSAPFSLPNILPRLSPLGSGHLPGLLQGHPSTDAAKSQSPFDPT